MTLAPDAARRAEDHILRRLPPTDLPGTGLRLHLAGPQSRLSRLVAAGGAPYWAHPWPGGLALALHLAADPGAVRGRPVADLGTGSGLAALAAARAGARRVLGFDADPLALVALGLNAALNPPARVGARLVAPDALAEALAEWAAASPGGVVLAGDVFYDAAASRAATAALDALPVGVEALVGDIGRAPLPLDRLAPLAAYPVRDVGDPPGIVREGRVFRWLPPP